VGFHHQSLLIASYWPKGRGNVGYGANVGSNHTGKAPDQELWHGEGVFYGLGCCIKFPSNFLRAPYTLFSTGVTTLPQTMEFPFSLVTTPAEAIPGLSPAFNELMPGWILSDNIWQLLRNEAKFLKRGRKCRRVVYEHRPIRGETVDMMLAARRELLAAHPGMPGVLRDAKGGAIYLGKHVGGLGKNFIKETSRVKAIEAYTMHCRYYALRGLWDFVCGGVGEGGKGGVGVGGVGGGGGGGVDGRGLERRAAVLRVTRQGAVLGTWEPDGGEVDEFDFCDTAVVEASGLYQWHHVLSVLRVEFPEGSTLHYLLEALVGMAFTVANDAERCKAKDDKRGVGTIPGYADAHEAAADTVVVRDAVAFAEQLRADVAGFVRNSGSGFSKL
jgi:hypothetical protein